MAITAAVACPRICRAAQPGSWQRLERDRPARPQPAPQDRGKPPKIYHRRLVEDRRAQATVERRRRGLRALGLIRDGRRFGTPRSGAPPKPERAAVPERPGWSSVTPLTGQTSTSIAPRERGITR
jgi:hypothetical protein